MLLRILNIQNSKLLRVLHSQIITGYFEVKVWMLRVFEQFSHAQIPKRTLDKVKMATQMKVIMKELKLLQKTRFEPDRLHYIPPNFEHDNRCQCYFSILLGLVGVAISPSSQYPFQTYHFVIIAIAYRFEVLDLSSWKAIKRFHQISKDKVRPVFLIQRRIVSSKSGLHGRPSALFGRLKRIESTRYEGKNRSMVTRIQSGSFDFIQVSTRSKIIEDFRHLFSSVFDNLNAIFAYIGLTIQHM